MQQSDVAKFRQEQALQEQAAQQALYGFTVVASHASITARMERGADRLLALLNAGNIEEAARLWSTKEWALEGEPCHITRARKE